MDSSKSPDGLDAAFDQLITNFLSIRCRNGYDAHQNLIGPAEAFQLLHGIDRMTILRLIHLGINVETSQNVQAVFLKTLMIHQRLTQLACTDQNCIRGVVVAKKLLNILNQMLPDITNLGPAAIGDHSQVFTDLNLAHVQRIGDGSCGNIRRIRILNALQIGMIAGQTLQNGFRDFFIH